MLNDTYRNDCYDDGIKRAVEAFRDAHGRAPVVLDIGCGTGLLALMAARAGAAHVIACEKLPGMAGLAQETVAENGLQDTVSVVPRASSELDAEDITRLAGQPACDLVVSEILGTLLIDEVGPSVTTHASNVVNTALPRAHG